MKYLFYELKLKYADGMNSDYAWQPSGNVNLYL